MRRRAAIEPVIGHLKAEHRLGRNYLAHHAGDAALAFTLFGFAAFLLAMAAIVVLPLILSPIGFRNLTETVTRIAR